MFEADVSFAFSRPPALLIFAGPAVCALGLMAISTALHETRLSRSTSAAANVWAPRCDFRTYTAKRSSFFPDHLFFPEHL